MSLIRPRASAPDSGTLSTNLMMISASLGLDVNFIGLSVWRALAHDWRARLMPSLAALVGVGVSGETEILMPLL